MSKLPEVRFQAAEFSRRIWDAKLEAGTDFQEVFNPEFWAHNARRMRQRDLVFVGNDEDTLFAILRVRASGPSWAKVSPVLVEGETEPAVDDEKDAAPLFVK